MGGFYGYSRFAGAAPELFPGGPAFIGGSDQGVFYGSDTGFIQGAKNQGVTWVPATSSLRTQAANKWLELSSPDVSGKDAAFKASMAQKLETLLNSFYGAVGNHSIMGYSVDATQQIVYIGDQIKAALRQLVAYRVTPTVLEESLPAHDSASIPNGSAVTVREGSAVSVGGDASSSSPVPYIALGVGAIALVGGVLLLRRKSSSTAGYRRRRSRR